MEIVFSLNLYIVRCCEPTPSLLGNQAIGVGFIIMIDENLRKDLEKGLIRSKTLLNSFLFLSPLTTKTAAFCDPKYIPFYYHLGKYINPKSFLEIGITLGFFSGSFFQSNKSVEHFMGFQTPEEPICKRFLVKNIRSVYKNRFDLVINNYSCKDIVDYNWDLVLLDKDMNYDIGRTLLDRVWDKINPEGYLVFERLLEKKRYKIFSDFCKIHQKDPLIFKTRYLVGIVQR